jgi:hypothetical protein
MYVTGAIRDVHDGLPEKRQKHEEKDASEERR